MAIKFIGSNFYNKWFRKKYINEVQDNLVKNYLVQNLVDVSFLVPDNKVKFFNGCTMSGSVFLVNNKSLNGSQLKFLINLVEIFSFGNFTKIKVFNKNEDIKILKILVNIPFNLINWFFRVMLKCLMGKKKFKQGELRCLMLKNSLVFQIFDLSFFKFLGKYVENAKKWVTDISVRFFFNSVLKKNYFNLVYKNIIKNKIY